MYIVVRAVLAAHNDLPTHQAVSQPADAETSTVTAAWVTPVGWIDDWSRLSRGAGDRKGRETIRDHGRDCMAATRLRPSRVN